jgi:5-methylcytosine-specific restriction endonuclease McrA
LYRTLLQAAFFHSTRPYLPKDDDILWMLADCDTKDFWMSNKNKVVARFYTEIVDGQEMLAHGRVMRDWQRLLDKRDKMSANGRAAWGDKHKSDGLTRSQRLEKARKKGSHTEEEWEALVEICGDKCVRCSIPAEELEGGVLTKDHIKQLYKGGNDSISNIQPMCRNCNSRKKKDDTDYRPKGWAERLQKVCKTSLSKEVKQVSKASEVEGSKESSPLSLEQFADKVL